MADPQPNIQVQADQGSGAQQGIMDKGVLEEKQDTAAGFNADHQLQQLRDSPIMDFSSPYYDPFGDDRELEADLGAGAGGGRQAGTAPATIQAYDSTGAHRS